MVKKVFKYATGVPIPEGAIYLNTKTQKINNNGTHRLVDEWLVWHYFLVEVEE